MRRAGIAALALALGTAGVLFGVRALEDPAVSVGGPMAEADDLIALVSTNQEVGTLTFRSVDGRRRQSIEIDVPGSVTDPSWSPDGSRMVFTGAGEGGDLDIYSADADGTKVVRLTSTQLDHSPAWSPDGTTIAYISTDPMGKGSG